MIKVDLPEPFSPTTASLFPTSKRTETFFNAQLSEFGYRKLTFRNSTLYFLSRRFSVVRLPWYILFGRSKKVKIFSTKPAFTLSSFALVINPVKPEASLLTAPTY